MAEIPKKIGRYDILEMVGRGGMGVLYRARDPSLERDVALKMMLVDFTLDQSARERFQREAKAVARLQHRNVVTIHELGEADGAPYIVMEFLSGQDLEAMINAGKTMTLPEKLDVVIQLCEGLGYAHEQGIVHRDIKPSNVRVLEDGTVKILDFGIAKFAVSTVTQSGTVMGTASYMSPEQIMGQAVDGRADLFSAGVLLHELLCNKKPFAGDAPTAVVYQIMHVEPPTVRSIVPELPEALDEIVLRALAKKADERYSRASEMAADLQMVKMMMDLPLNSGETSSAVATSATPTPSPITGKLHATMIGQKGGQPATVVLKTPMRASAEAAAADAAPRGSEHVHGNQKSGGMIWIAAAVGAVVIGVGGWLLFRGGGAPPPATTGTQVAQNSAPTTPAPAPTPPPSTTTGTTSKTDGATRGGSSEPSAPPPKRSNAAPPGPVAPGLELLAVSSNPSGARIVLNGTDTGKVTPQALQLNPKQANTIELSLRGYQTARATISDGDLRNGSRDFDLKRTAGPVQLTVSASYPFDVLQGEKVLAAGQMRHEVTVEPGAGAVKVRSKDYMLNQTVSVDFSRGSMEVTLPAPGKLFVFSNDESCTLTVDEFDLGYGNWPNKNIAPGAHNLTVKCAGGRTETKAITIGPGDKQEVRFTKPKLRQEP